MPQKSALAGPRQIIAGREDTGYPGFAGSEGRHRLIAMVENAGAPIYLVDDDDAVRDSLKLLLESHGLEVRDFGGVAAFLQGYENGKGACLILDLHLPIVGGLDLIKIMEHRKMALPVIFITGRGDAEVKARALEAGAMAFLEKPVNETMLMNAIHAATQRGAGPAVARR